MSADSPKYIAVDGRSVQSIIKKCDDRSCDKYHEWVQLSPRASRWDSEQIAKAMNAMEAQA